MILNHPDQFVISHRMQNRKESRTIFALIMSLDN